ncbi:MAG: GNAT family N-acetyltransferase [Bacteroidales bacterium]|nr:GNAT family N-acetyltransferase [Bacteroidales bacterium]
MKDIRFTFCDFSNPVHQITFLDLLNHYMTDPMGGCEPMKPDLQKLLISGISKHPASFILFIENEVEPIGMAVCFINFSTFKAKPYINVHDLIVRNTYRGKGVGRKLLQQVIAIAEERDYCKVTLEVRDDNHNAKHLYKSLGFNDTEPVMHFWTRVI